jgi:hypothetical protein
MASCPKCGWEVAEDDRFCPNCGAAIGEAQAPERPASRPEELKAQPVRPKAAPPERGDPVGAIWFTALCSVVTLLSFFFLSWSSLRGFLSIISTGYGLASSGISRASGLPLSLLFAIPAAAFGCILLCLPFLKAGDRTSPLVPIAQIVLVILGLLSFILLPFEFRTWSGGKVVAEFGLWLAAVAMIGALIGGFTSLSRVRDSGWR